MKRQPNGKQRRLAMLGSLWLQAQGDPILLDQMRRAAEGEATRPYTVANSLPRSASRPGRSPFPEDWEPEAPASDASESEPVTLPAAITERIASLPAKHRLILEMRYGLAGQPERSVAEIAERLLISPQRVYRILTVALSRLGSGIPRTRRAVQQG